MYFESKRAILTFLSFLYSVDPTQQDEEEEINVKCPCGNDEVCDILAFEDILMMSKL